MPEAQVGFVFCGQSISVQLVRLPFVQFGVIAVLQAFVFGAGQDQTGAREVQI